MAHAVNETAVQLRIIRRPEVESRVGLARSTIYELIKEGKFPAPVQLGARAVGWFESEIEAWLRDKAAFTRGQLANH